MVLHTRNIKSLSLCSGAAGLDLGIKLALPKSRVVCFVEHEVTACEVLAARIADESLDDAPIWTDLRTFDGRPWRGKVDLITAGFPCQPFSVAGKQRGTDDPRHLWPHVRRVIKECAPSIVFLENVPGLLNVLTPDGRYAYEMVRDELEELGFRVTEGLFSAAEVGAPHRRERLFILAVADARGFASVRNNVRERFISQEPEWQSTQSIRQDGERRIGGVGPHSYDLADAGHAERAGRGEPAGRSEGQPCGQPASQGGPVADSGIGQFPQPWGGTEGRTGARPTGADDASGWMEDAVREGLEGGVSAIVAGPQAGRRGLDPDTGRSGGEGLPAFPPGPGDTAAWGRILADRPDLAPALPQSPVRGVADGLGTGMDLTRAARLRLTGNGVVPAQAALAFTSLWTRL